MACVFLLVDIFAPVIAVSLLLIHLYTLSNLAHQIICAFLYIIPFSFYTRHLYAWYTIQCSVQCILFCLYSVLLAVFMFENETTQFFNSAQSIFVYTSFLFAHHNADYYFHGNYIACELNYVYCTQRVMYTCIMTKQKHLQIQRKQKSNDIAAAVVVVIRRRFYSLTGTAKTMRRWRRRRCFRVFSQSSDSLSLIALVSFCVNKTILNTQNGREIYDLIAKRVYHARSCVYVYVCAENGRG